MTGAELASSNGPEPPDVELDRFRRIMGSLVSGVSVVSSIDVDEKPCGLTCSAVCSVSVEPPLLLSCVRAPSSTLDAIRSRGCFTVNFLDADGPELSEIFASRTKNKFATVRLRPSELTAMPVLESALAYADCVVHEFFQAGDHVVVLGRVIDGEAYVNRSPLAYWRRGYVQVFRLPGQRADNSPAGDYEMGEGSNGNRGAVVAPDTAAHPTSTSSQR